MYCLVWKARPHIGWPFELCGWYMWSWQRPTTWITAVHDLRPCVHWDEHSCLSSNTIDTVPCTRRPQAGCCSCCIFFPIYPATPPHRQPSLFASIEAQNQLTVMYLLQQLVSFAKITICHRVFLCCTGIYCASRCHRKHNRGFCVFVLA